MGLYDIDHIGEFRVEQDIMPRPGNARFYDLSKDPDGCLHTTEGDTVDGARATLRAKFSPPHFITGQGRVVLTRPITKQGAALRTPSTGTLYPNHYVIQIEMVERTKQTLWLPEPETLEPTLAVMQWCQAELGIPLRRAYPWPDLLQGGPWAVETNPHRRDAVFPMGRGWWGHVDVPFNTHWDPGSLNWTKLFEMAGGEDMTDDEKQILADAKAFLDALREDLGAKEAPKKPARPAGAGKRVAAATLKAEATP